MDPLDHHNHLKTVMNDYFPVVLRHEGSRINGGGFLKLPLGGSGIVPGPGSHRHLTASGLVFIRRRPQPHRVL